MNERDVRSDSLWDPGAPADADIAALERALAPVRLRAGLDVSRLTAGDREPRREPIPIRPYRGARPGGSRRWAVAALVMLAGGAAWLAERPPAGAGRSPWALELLGGVPTVDSRAAWTGARLREGQWLATGAGGSARVRARGIGAIDLRPDTRVRLVEVHGAQKVMELASGTIDAFITSPPRVFLVDTPAGRAIDMGCAYTLTAGAGQTELSVSLGYVILEGAGRSSTVPMGASCVMRPGMGPGLPAFDDAPEGFRTGAFMFDIGKDPRGGLEAMLLAARRKDAMTLWHVLQRVDAEDRAGVYDVLARLDPPPRGVTRAGALALDEGMLRAWWERLGM